MQDLTDLAEVEKDSGLEGRMIVILFTPKPNSKKKAAAKMERQDNAKTQNE